MGVAFAGLTAAAVSAAAPPPLPPPLDVERTVYTPRDGAPAGITALAQTSDGFLWVGTSAGLFRFDGARFTRYVPPAGQALEEQDITVLRATADVLWAGTRFGRVYRIEPARLRVYGPADGLAPLRTIEGLDVDGQGVAWAASSQGVLRLAGDHWTGVPGPDGKPLRVAAIDSLLAGRDGRVWTVTEDSLFALDPGARAFTARAPVHFPGGLFVGPRGEPWGIDQHGSFPLAYPQDCVTQADMAQVFPDRRDWSAFSFFDREGRAWGDSDGQHFVVPSDWASDPRVRAAKKTVTAQVPRSEEAPRHGGQPAVESFLEDREGNVWVGLSDRLLRYRATKFHRVEVGGQPLGPGGLATTASGRLWVFARSEIGTIEDGAFVPRPSALLEHTGLVSLAETRDDGLYVGTAGHLFRNDAAGWAEVALPASNRPFVIQSVTEDVRGDLWISQAPGGVFRRHDGAWQRNGGIGGLVGGAALVLKADAAGSRVWIGYPSGDVAIVEGERARVLGGHDGAAVGSVLAFLPTTGGAWVGGTTGLALFDGTRFHPVATVQGEPLSSVSGIVRSATGEVWLNTATGVVRIPADEVARFVADPTRRLQSETFGVLAGVEGVPQTLRPLPSATADADGKLWFDTSNGLFWIDPQHIARNQVAPQVAVVGVVHDGQRLPGTPPGTAKLPELTRSLQFDYTAPALAVPEQVRFKYRLDGVDADWQDAASRRQAFYTNLRPGHYDFRVMASNEDGVWSANAATIGVDIPAAFWQTNWFRSCWIASLAALAYLVHVMRTRVLAQRARIRLHDLLRERERIARELHDTLLQGTQGLVLNFQVIAGEMGREDDRRRRMEALLDEADSVIAQARDRVYDLRDLDNEQADLPAALAVVGADLAAGTSTSFEVRTSADLPQTRPDVRSEVFLAVREALLNAFQHASARTIVLELRRRRRTFVILVRDDGRGIDPLLVSAGGREGHWGLTGMRERAERLGGRVAVAGVAGGGTEVCIELPGRVVFVPPANRMAAIGVRVARWLRQFARRQGRRA